jgi:hypothetical protein
LNRSVQAPAVSSFVNWLLSCYAGQHAGSIVKAHNKQAGAAASATIKCGLHAVRSEKFKNSSCLHIGAAAVAEGY